MKKPSQLFVKLLNKFHPTEPPFVLSDHQAERYHDHVFKRTESAIKVNNERLAETLSYLRKIAETHEWTSMADARAYYKGHNAWMDYVINLSPEQLAEEIKRKRVKLNMPTDDRIK